MKIKNLLKKSFLSLFIIVPILICGTIAYVYFFIPLIWPALYSDLAHADIRGKMYHFAQLESLKKQAARLEKQGKKNIAANQIIHETHWLCHSTRDFARIDTRLDDLRSAIVNPSFIGASDEQSASDGSWGRWYTEWFFKLDASYEQIKILSEKGSVPEYPIRFFDRVNSPEKMTHHLRRLSVSEMDKDGIDNSRELNETISAFIRMVTKKQPANYAFHPQLKQALTDFIINELVDPSTGYLAYRYKSGTHVKTRISLSMTFHVVQYLDRNIINWQKLITTTLAMKDKEFKDGGWLDNGLYLNHHNMDVVELFRLAWPYVTEDLEETMRIEIRKMLDWCLKESLQPDGSFRKTAFENDSVEEYTYFGASFLSRVGYFDKQKRFWTHEEFPDAQKHRGQIINFIHRHIDAGGAGGTYYRNALRQLGDASNRGDQNAKTL